MSKNTVERYLDLLQKAFVLINVGGFSRNLRKEITKTSRYYFWDNGVLWENFLFTERLKRNAYVRNNVTSYFWRTYDQQEIDLVEENAAALNGFEFKYKPRRIKAPAAWSKTYLEANYEVISRENYLQFVADA